MLSRYLLRGLQAGLIGGLVFGLFVAAVAGPLVGAAETAVHGDGSIGEGDHGGDEGHEAATGEHGESHSHGEHRTAEQVEVGGLALTVSTVTDVLAGILWGAILGTLAFGLGYYLLEPALGGPLEGRLLLGAIGFLTVSGAPWLVVPPLPPGVEIAVATETRLLWYGVAMATGGLTCLLSIGVYRRGRDRFGRETAILAAVIPFGLLAGPILASPALVAENPLSASFVAAYRGVVLFGQVVLWAVLAAAHARLAERTGPLDRVASEYRSVASE